MERRYHMNTNDGRFVEMPFTTVGLAFLHGLRKGRSDLFKYQRITEVLQAYPSKVAVGELHTYGL